MTVFEYIIDTLPKDRDFEAIQDPETPKILGLAMGMAFVTVTDREFYFMVEYTTSQSNEVHYTQTSNKHELLGLLVELTK